MYMYKYIFLSIPKRILQEVENEAKKHGIKRNGPLCQMKEGGGLGGYWVGSVAVFGSLEKCN
jgi:hypothetical protein